MTPPKPPTFVERIASCAGAHALLPGPGAPREPVIVAVSGGADSVALLRALVTLARTSRFPMALVAAHLHHGLREHTADEDQVFVESLAGRLGLPCAVGKADVPAEAAAAGVGVEEAARRARRAFLAQVARSHGARRVALGHTADDRAETVLFNVLRGTGIEGLAAMAPRAPLVAEDGIEIVRPLIEVSRSEVLAFLEAQGQPWREDETNASDAYTRNRLRNELLPAIRQTVNPKVDDALARLSDQAAAASDVLADALEAVWLGIVREVPAPRAVVIDADDFEPLRPWMQGAILRRAVQRLGGGLKHMSAERTRAAVDALLARTVAGPVDLPGGLVAQRRRRVIRIGEGKAERGRRNT